MNAAENRIKKIMDERGVGLLEAKRIEWSERMLQATEDAQTVADLKEIIIQIIGRIA